MNHANMVLSIIIPFLNQNASCNLKVTLYKDMKNLHSYFLYLQNVSNEFVRNEQVASKKDLRRYSAQRCNNKIENKINVSYLHANFSFI